MQAFEDARIAVSEARSSGAGTYAPGLLAKAVTSWNEALGRLASENSRWRVVRDYTASEAAAQASAEFAGRAKERARAVHDSLAWNARIGIDAVRDQLMFVQESIRRLPHSVHRHNAVSEASTLVALAERALARDDVVAASELVDRSRRMLFDVGADVNGSLESYLSSLATWQRWSEETKRWSEDSGRRAILVDKMGRSLHVLENGKTVRTFSVEFGPNWMGQKRHEGDESTPEGRYRVVRLRGEGQTAYFRALEIDYPNPEDLKRFEADRRAGRISSNARIGGLIEIHGSGGRGADWTRGCVAMSNPDMEELFGLAFEGMPVTIVGALNAPVFANGSTSDAPATR